MNEPTTNTGMSLLTDTWAQVLHWPVALVIAALALIVGLLCKKSAWIPNQKIPAIVVLFTTALYVVLGDPKTVTNVAAGWRAYFMLGAYGAILGFLVWGAHHWILHRLESLLPAGFFPVEEFDTVSPLTKPENKPAPVPEEKKG